MDALFESVASALVRGDRVVLRRFGVFHTRPRKTGKARNPRTGEAAGIPPERVVRFRPASTPLARDYETLAATLRELWR